MKMVSYTPETLPSLTDKRRANLKTLAARPDGEIDYGDIPPMTDEQLKNAVRGRFYKPTKRQITARVDADVLEGMAQITREGLPIPHQCHPAAGNVGLTQR
jgi:uncharacterized protein (DUF4415 family)